MQAIRSARHALGDRQIIKQTRRQTDGSIGAGQNTQVSIVVPNEMGVVDALARNRRRSSASSAIERRVKSHTKDITALVPASDISPCSASCPRSYSASEAGSDTSGPSDLVEWPLRFSTSVMQTAITSPSRSHVSASHSVSTGVSTGVSTAHTDDDAQVVQPPQIKSTVKRWSDFDCEINRYKAQFAMDADNAPKTMTRQHVRNTFKFLKFLVLFHSRPRFIPPRPHIW